MADFKHLAVSDGQLCLEPQGESEEQALAKLVMFKKNFHANGQVSYV